jgi:rhomboid protease GluP
MSKINIYNIQKQLPPFFATYVIIVTLVSIYLLLIVLFPFSLLVQSNEALYRFALITPLVIQGDYYRLFTAMWIHKDIIHLISNILFLFIFAVRLEELERMKRGYIVILIFITSGLIGNIFTFGFYFLEININSLGSSGGVFGLLGALVFLLRGKSKHERRKMYYLIIIFFTITIGQDTNVISHIAGFFGGFFSMQLISRRD